MAPHEPHSHSFVVRIWLEETVEEAGDARWRGQVMHVPGGERRYVEDLESLCRFIAPYLREEAREQGLTARFTRWFRRWIRPRTNDAG
jgi:hypothetical protein